MEVILASQSPRRRELMGLLRIPFSVRVADVEETLIPGEPPQEAVARLSREKALAIPRKKEDVVIAADTVVVCAGQILGKPRDEADAARMLHLLSGRSHQVMTGLTLLRGDTCLTHTEVTDLTFRSLSDQEIDDYICTGEPMDKAGAYGIQSGGALFVQHLAGDYFNVVGLPVCRLNLLLQQIMEETQ